MGKLRAWVKIRVLIPMLTHYQGVLDRIIKHRRKKMDRRYDSFNQTEQDFQGEDYQYLLKCSQSMDRLTLHQQWVQEALTDLDGGQVLLLPIWGGEEAGEEKDAARKIW